MSTQRALYGGVDDDIRAAFLNLSKNQMLNFLFYYEKKYGASARNYAENAIFEWQSGLRRMSAQTTERLLSLLPPFLGTEAKIELIRKLREKHRQVSTQRVSVTTLNYRDVIYPLAEDLIGRAYTANLPLEIESRLSWLSDSDSEAAKTLLAGAEAAASALAFKKIDEEFAKMHQVLSTGKSRQIEHTITLPYGILNITITKGEPMSEQERKGTIIPASHRGLTTSDQILEQAMQNLTPEQLAQVSKIAAEQAFAIHVEAKKADLRHSNATRDFDVLIERAQKLEAMEMDSEVKQSFNTASGTSTVHLSKNKTKLWIYVAVALAILVVLLILKR